MKKRLGPVERLFPMPCVLVVGGTMDEADTLAVAWINIVSSTPPTIAMGLRKTRRTLELIRATGGTFTVNVPDTKLAAAGRLLRHRRPAGPPTSSPRPA